MSARRARTAAAAATGALVPCLAVFFSPSWSAGVHSLRPSAEGAPIACSDAARQRESGQSRGRKRRQKDAERASCVGVLCLGHPAWRARARPCRPPGSELGFSEKGADPGRRPRPAKMYGSSGSSPVEEGDRPRSARTQGRAREKIAMVTAYDYTMARLVDEAGVDMVLVGDSLGMVVQGLTTTIPVTLDEMAYHCRAVARGLGARAPRRRHAVHELPGLAAAGGRERRQADEGGRVREREARRRPGGRRARAPDRARRHPGHGSHRAHAAERPRARRLQGAGPRRGRRPRRCSPTRARSSRPARSRSCSRRSRRISRRGSRRAVSIPTIGIGAGAACDGQVLVCTDLLGMSRGHQPKFAKRFANLGDAVVERVQRRTSSEVRAGAFPGARAHVQAERGARIGAGPSSSATRARCGDVRRRARRSARARSLALTIRCRGLTSRDSTIFRAVARDLEYTASLARRSLCEPRIVRFLRRFARAGRHVVFDESRGGRAAEIAAWSNGASAVALGAAYGARVGAASGARARGSVLRRGALAFARPPPRARASLTLWIAAVGGTLTIAAGGGTLAWLFAHLVETRRLRRWRRSSARSSPRSPLRGATRRSHASVPATSAIRSSSDQRAAFTMTSKRATRARRQAPAPRASSTATP